MSTRWWGWGDPAKSYDLDHRPGFWPYMAARLGTTPRRPAPAVALEQVEIPPPRASAAALDALAAAVGREHLSTAHEARVRHAYGKGYLDLLRLRRGEVPNPPDAVAYPESEDEVLRLLHAAAEEGLAVIPFGGGTSVTGGVEAPQGGRPALCVDLRRLNRIEHVDAGSLCAAVQAGILGPALEKGLNAHGVTLGHFPQSFEFSTLGGWIATRSAGHASTGYGKIEAMVVALRMAAPAGIVTTREVPSAASGMGLKDALIGSEGTLGVLTRAVVRVHPLPERRDYRACLFPDFEAGVDAVRAMLQEGPVPTTARISDGPETEAFLALRPRAEGWRARVLEWAGARLFSSRGFRAGAACLGIIGVEGRAGLVARTWTDLGRLLRRFGAFPLGAGPGRTWYRERFDLPYLRDVLLDAGLLVDTMETAATWGRLLPLYRGVARALRDSLRQENAEPLVLCHLSHAYPTGASLYYTVVAPQAPGRETAQWQAAKIAATEAIVSGGGTLSHHHGVGEVHRAWMRDEHGEEGLRVMRAVKAALDPPGIMNPGKVLPDDGIHP